MNYEDLPDHVVFSATGKWLGFIQNNGQKPNQVGTWNAANGVLENKFDVDTGTNLTALAFNLDDTLIAVGREDGSILLVDASSGEILNTLIGHTGKITALAFTADGLYMVSGSEDGTVGFWGVSNR